MIEPNLTILYVDSPAQSAAFYTAFFGQKPAESSPTFAMFAFPSGAKLAFWSRHTVEPAALNTGWNGEVAFTVGSREEVDAAFAKATGDNIQIAQKPTELDFGYTFVALDPDGHRLRIFTPED